MEKIEVRYTYLGKVAGQDYYHKYIVYTDSNGQQWGARGGPSKSPQDASGASTQVERDNLIPGDDGDSPFGSIDAKSEEYRPSTDTDPGFIDYDYEGDRKS